MTEKQFFKVYSNRLQEFINFCKDKVQKLSDEDSQTILDEIQKQSGNISEKGNLLISEIMSENNLDYNYPVIQKTLTTVPISSILLHKSFSIQLEFRKDYDDFTKEILSEALCRDFPQDCIKEL